MRESPRGLPTPPRSAPYSIRKSWYRRIRWWWILGALALAGLGAWAGRQVVLFQLTVQESERVLAKMERRVAAIPPLTEDEITQLRRSLNDAHLSEARRMGMTPVIRRNRLMRIARDSGLVLIESTPRFLVLDAAYSIPLMTHGVRRTLDSISVRFWDDLAERKLPGFRFTISSMLRSAEDQAALQGVNINATGERSSHEYGTTFDLTYRRFDYRAGMEPDLMQLSPQLAPGVKGRTRAYILKRRAVAYRRMAQTYAPQLAASLGRALISLEDDGILLALREEQQPVYHVTTRLAPDGQ